MIARFLRWWQTFFMDREVPYGMALVRITLPLVLLVGVLPRWWHVREIYSTDGTPTPLWVSYGTSALLPMLSAPIAVALFSVLIFCLVTASLGWRTRLSLGIATVLYLCFGLLDMVTTLTKYTVLASHALLLLTLSDCGGVWSVDAWLKRRAAHSPLDPRPTSAVWTRRLLQLLVASCYLGSAFTKMHTPEYFSGELMLFWMMANVNFENRVGEYLSLFPAVTLVSAYFTILWEVLFIALIWRRPWRGLMLSVGVVFHIMSALMLGLIVFPMVCISLYFVFLDESEGERLAIAARNLRRRWSLMPVALVSRWPLPRVSGMPTGYSAACFGMLACVCAVAGVEIEYRRDVYGERGPQGPLTLKPINEDRMAEMLAPERPLRPQDMFFAFDVGTTTMGGQLADRRERYRSGETAILQCSMTPPHPDMWVEVSLHDATDRVVRRYGQVIPRESLRSIFTYEFEDVLNPGRYDFVVTYDETEIARRSFTFESVPTEASSPVRLTSAP